jgi:hypothetical protein
MSEMSTQPVLKCKRCGKVYTFSLRTTTPDSEGALLHKLMDGVLKDGLCSDCTARKSWYIQQNRLPDWEKGLP